MSAFTPNILIEQVRAVGQNLTDPRQGKNTSYPLPDILVGALSVFFMQCASFLEYQERMEQAYGMNNARNLFGITKIPTGQQMRNVLDTITPASVFGIFQWCFATLLESGGIKYFQSELGYLLALDGTEYFSSETIHCQNCSTKEHKKGVKTYSHQVITPVLVKPGVEHVLPLSPEFIIPQDGDQKQDCENKAGKRWLKSKGQELLTKLQSVNPVNPDSALDSNSEVTILGDDLYAHQPFCQQVLNQGFNFILVCKPDSHKTLYEWVNGITHGKVQRTWDGKYHRVTTYRFVENVPLKNDPNALLVNFVEVEIKREEDGKKLYRNAFVTNHPVNEETVEAIVSSGRARWKIENENNNTLKTKGYHFEHNYGHGKLYLSSLLITLILIAFLFHTLLDLTHQGYQQVRKLIGARIRFFNDLKTLTKYSCYRNFDHLFSWMYRGLTKGQHHPNYALPPPLVYTAT
jgi:hypothetical protein